MGYNAPNFFSSKSFAPKLRKSLQAGDMRSVASNLSWGGPSKARIAESQSMMRQGPQDLLSAPARSKPKVTPQESPNRYFGQGLVEGVKGMFSGFQKRQTGGVVGSSANLSSSSPQHLERFDEAQSKFFDLLGNQTSQSVVIVKRSAPPASPPAPAKNEMLPSGSGLNTVEISKRFHRLRSGSSY